MKPANFPGRKNARRKSALARMRFPAGLNHAEKAEHPYFQTKRKIMDDETARSIRTKQDRSARGVLRK